jgi:hypothetical protein
MQGRRVVKARNVPQRSEGPEPWNPLSNGRKSLLEGLLRIFRFAPALSLPDQNEGRNPHNDSFQGIVLIGEGWILTGNKNRPG